MKNFRFALLLLGVLTLLDAQPTNNIIQRIMTIEFRNERGTAFSIDRDDREYWITARHILTGAQHPPYGRVPSNTVDLKMLNPGGAGEQWLTTRFTVLQPASDADVVVLIPGKPLLPNITSKSPPAAEGLTIGANCEFLGYPYGGGWRGKFSGSTFWLPYVKHCIISGMDQEAHMWILDGINNAGFSGGPVIVGTGTDLKIAAVISGYIQEPADVIPQPPALILERGKIGRQSPKTPPAPKETVNLNSGFILAYDISHAVDIIKEHPIGPVRRAN